MKSKTAGSKASASIFSVSGSRIWSRGSSWFRSEYRRSNTWTCISRWNSWPAWKKGSDVYWIPRLNVSKNTHALCHAVPLVQKLKKVMESYAHQNWCKCFRGRRPRKCFRRFWCAYHSLRTPTPTSKKPAENIGANIRVGVRKSNVLQQALAHR